MRSGTAGHAGAVQIVCDPAKVGYVDLLQVHVATHDPSDDGQDTARAGRPRPADGYGAIIDSALDAAQPIAPSGSCAQACA